VDFVLTIAISVAAAASAVIAYFPGLAAGRTTIAVMLCAVVAAGTWFGHIGRSVFATMTAVFITASVPIVVLGFLAPHAQGPSPVVASGGGVSLWTVVLAFPVAMALAQLGQLDDRGRERFGRITLWLTFGIEGTLTIAIAALAVRSHVGVPAANSTLIADVARNAVGTGTWFAAFQIASSLLLLAAASSSFQAGPGLLKALARQARDDGSHVGILPPTLGLTNRHHTPYWSVVVYLTVSVAVVVAAHGRDQELVLYYAVAVFVSFLSGLLAMARFSRREGAPVHAAINLIGASVVLFTIVVNVRRGYPIASLVAAGLIGTFFHRLWVRQGRPRGIAMVAAEAERELGDAAEPGSLA
jgi:hypothetical protein